MRQLSRVSRGLWHRLRLGGASLKRIASRGLEPLLRRLMRSVLARTALANRINRHLLRFPRLHSLFRRIAQRAGLLPPPPEQSPTIAHAPIPDPRALSPRAQRIHADLRQAIARYRESPR